MKITVMTSDEQFITLDVDQDESVENVKALLEVETSVALHHQHLHFNGKEIRNSDRLGSVGVKEGDLIMMLPPDTGPSPNELRINPDGSASDPASLLRRIQSDSQLMSQLLQDDPALGQALLGGDLDKMQNILRERHQQKLQLRNKQAEELTLMHADPFDVESQRKIEAAIRQRGIDDNMAAALEYNPEAFARVVMLYVNMEVNGTPLKAFVDSGAQSTIISKSCAERCGLLRLMDQRYKGVAVGVGQTEILGRIHVAPIKIGHLFFTCSFTVLDAPNMEFLFGLDMLRKHQQAGGLESKVAKLVELGFDAEAVKQALRLFNGNEEQAAAYLFGG
ncbi:hypothetical protein KSP40_PGU005806 [Platanthera guangdongensis]|uniref:DNA damage-inducible protein 1 n=1 Tax=Platanthera guangdongensis TaxID=2320717 RepID=A0ABR2ME39_9ASPA